MALNWNTVPQLTPALKRLGTDFNTRFPRRDSASDGAWGDAAHKLSPSGHNPDDTAGSLSESEDADSLPEIRAIDVDADLGEPGVTMQQLVDRIVATPADRARLSYVIFNYRICGDFNGWTWKAYRGDNPHDKHAHFSGKPSKDADNAPFTSVRDFNVSTPAPAADPKDDPIMIPVQVPHGFAYDESQNTSAESKQYVVSVPVEPVGFPANPWFKNRRLAVSLSSDHTAGGAPVKARVAVWDGVRWHVKVYSVAAGGRVDVALPAPAGPSAFNISVGRMKSSAAAPGSEALLPLSVLVTVL